MAENSQTSVSNSKSRIFSIAALCFVLLSCQKQPSDTNQPSGTKQPDPKPPDLSDCTHVELRYSPTILRRVFGSKPQNYLNKEEIEYVQSLDKIVVDDPEFIKALAHDISLGTYWGPVEEGVSVPSYYIIYFVCYRKDERMTSFSKFPDRIETEDKNWFGYEKRWTRPQKPIIPEISHLKLRVRCAGKLRSLYQAFWFHFQKNKSYPSPDKWCDAVVQHNQDDVYGNDKYMEFFKCPSADEGECHYAINPNCKPDSPPDMVLLFETKAGWNQHGGPELFTFDNHDPKGGCVLLNDGNLDGVPFPTKLFIRTKDELHALRWK